MSVAGRASVGIDVVADVIAIVGTAGSARVGIGVIASVGAPVGVIVGVIVIAIIEAARTIVGAVGGA